MKIIFIGSVYFSKKILEKVITMNSHLVGVITKKDSLFNSDFEDLSPIAIRNKIPFIYANNINEPKYIEWIKSLDADIIFCFGWSSLLGKEILSVCPMGVIGFHPSLLPENRGRHPLIWAKVLGLTKTGTSFFFMDQGADTGDILSQKELVILFEDDARSLYKKMISNAIEQIELFLPKLQEGNFEREKQKTTGNVWRKRHEKDGLIDFRMSSESIANLVRGLAKPYAGAHCLYNNEKIKVWSLELDTCQVNSIIPGTILSVKSKMIKVKTQNGAVLLTDHDFKQKPYAGQYLS